MRETGIGRKHALLSSVGFRNTGGECQLLPAKAGSLSKGIRCYQGMGAIMSWTEAKNKRLCVLIEKKIDDSLTTEEEAELEPLQNEMIHTFEQLRIDRWVQQRPLVIYGPVDPSDNSAWEEYATIFHLGTPSLSADEADQFEETLPALESDCHVCGKPFQHCECEPNLIWESQFMNGNGE